VTRFSATLLLCIALLIASTVAGQSAPGSTNAPNTFPGASWQRITTLEKAGWSKEGLAAARQFAETDSMHTSAVMIVQGGEVVDQWGDFDKKIDAYSVRKSLISALYGIYSSDGLIDINETLEQLGIDDSPDPLTKEEKQARVVDLLRARSGVYHLVDFETASMTKNRPARGSHAPGTFWYYNNWDFNVLGTIFEKKTGLKIGQAFYERIAKPIGMQDFQPKQRFLFWWTCFHPSNLSFRNHSTRPGAVRFALSALWALEWKADRAQGLGREKQSCRRNDLVQWGESWRIRIPLVDRLRRRALSRSFPSWYLFGAGCGSALSFRDPDARLGRRSPYRQRSSDTRCEDHCGNKQSRFPQRGQSAVWPSPEADPGCTKQALISFRFTGRRRWQQWT
jgi:hypothetical protein